MEKIALISVSDKTGIEDLARKLSDLNFKILSTGGTFKTLQSVGISVQAISDYTGQKEILAGRVKTLHPKIHGGILAKRDDEQHLAELKESGINPIDLLVVNLYPFEKGLEASPPLLEKEMIELIDVGGPSMIRGAAKNFSSVMTLVDPSDYEQAITELSNNDFNSSSSLAFRKKLAAKAFAKLADYNCKIAEYLSKEDIDDSQKVKTPNSRYKGFMTELKQELRYGENPHQNASFYVPLNKEVSWRQLNGKELSYNNLLDVDTAFRMIKSFIHQEPTVAILKHLNPCGAAQSPELASAYKAAKTGDPRSHFGGIVLSNIEIDEATARLITEDFKEIVVAPGYSEEALKVLSSKKNLRVVEISLSPCIETELRTACDGILIQQQDYVSNEIAEITWASGIEASESQLKDLNFAWTICAHVKSNAIVLVKDLSIIGVGAGQMSRIDSSEVALANAQKHGHQITGSVAASDAFFPFTDNIEVLAAAGVKAIIAPSGAKNDESVIEKSKELGIVFGFTQKRHFRH